MTGSIHIGVGGWTFEPWRGVFYPEGLTQKRELEFASRALTSIEINGTYYSTFKPDSWMKWRDETPDDFVFAVKASRYCTNRKVLSDGAESFERTAEGEIACDCTGRASIIERLTMLGIKLNAAANTERGKELLLSAPDSPIKVLVVPTNEELVIARDTRDIVSK